MLHGFDEQTEDLNEYELSLVPIFVYGLSNKVGKANAITNKKMVDKLSLQSYKVSDVRVRKIINYIRNNGLIKGLMASNVGYYVTDDPKEIKDYISSLEGRINAIQAIKHTFDNYYKELTTQNGKLF